VLLAVLTVAGAVVFAPTATALAALPGQDAPAGQAQSSPAGGSGSSEPDCGVGLPGIDTVLNGACDVGGAIVGGVGTAVDAVTGAPGAVAGAVAGGVFAEATRWMSDGAHWVTKQIHSLMDDTTTPELTARWYRERWKGMVALGAGLAALVAMLALTSAALRRDPDALGATFIGMFRAGLGTGLVIPLVVMALGVADWVTNFVVRDVTGGAGAKFWGDVSAAWDDGGGGFGSAAIEFFFALLNVLAGVAVWLEMLVRNAGIYVAVLFMAAALAASIWPQLRSWETRLTQLLIVLIATKPVIVVILSLAGSAAVAGGAGPDRDYGILLAAIMILILAALTPWVLLMIVSLDHGSNASVASAGLRGSAARGAARVGGGLGSAGSAAGRGAGRAGRAIGGRLGGGGGGGSKPSGASSPGGGAKGGGTPGGGPSAGASPGGGTKPGGGGSGGAGPGGGGGGAGAGSGGGGAPGRSAGSRGSSAPAGAVAAAAGLVPPPAQSPGGRGAGARGGTSKPRGGAPAARPGGVGSGSTKAPVRPPARPGGSAPRSRGQR
jgi:type IV secretion system protein TrbL